MFKRKKIVEYFWFLIIIFIFVASIQLTKNGFLINQIDSFGILAPIIYVLLKMSTLIIAPLGGTPLYFIAGALFGNVYGFILSLLGDALGSVTCFLLARFYGPKIVKTFIGEKFFEKVIHTVAVLSSIKSFIKARISLMAMPELLAYAGGFSKINFLTFFLINVLFYVPVDFAYVFFGHQIVAISSAHTFLFYGVAAAVTLSGLWFLYKDHRNLEKVEGM